MSYDMDNNVDQNWEEVVKWWQKAAENSNYNAQYKLGWCYRNGKGVKQNWEEAMKWYSKAAEQGNVNAQNNLGECYCKIEKIDETKAVMWFTRAAEQGNADAQYNLGRYLNKGNNGYSEWMTDECLELTRKAAEQGHIKAIISLYSFFINKYSREGEEEFVKWCRKAAEIGLNYAQTELGYIYRNGYVHRHFGNIYWNGDLVERNLKESVKWWHKAAEQGDVNAQIALGYYYENENWEESEKWYKKAAEQGRLPVFDIHYCDNNDNSRDTWDAMTDGMYGDMPDGFDGDYGFLGK